jgi:N-methylhydantoinase B
VNKVRVAFADGREHVPAHLSKDQGIPVRAGDTVHVTTPGGGGYGDPRGRDPALVERDLARGYYTGEQLRERFGVEPPAATSRPAGDAGE